MSKSKKKVNKNISDIDNIVRKIESDKDIEVKSNKKVIKHPTLNIFLFITLISSISYFITTLIFKKNDINLYSKLIELVLLLIFTFLFIGNSIASNKKKIGSIILSSFILIIYNIFGVVITLNLITIPHFNKVEDFTGKSLTDVVKWAEANNVLLVQNYEYSDMTNEYYIIEQNKSAGTNIKDIKSLTISVSQGPNPDKEVVVPSMITWGADKVLDFIKKNSLSNVEVEFVESDKVKDTVIEQSKSGSIKRNDELKLTFSLGSEDEIEDTKLSNLVGKSKFEVEFYLKQHAIKYEINNDFSNKYKRNYIIKQSIKAGTVINAKSDDKITITSSKGPKITVPNLKKMSMTQVTNWIIKNKLKLEFTEKYDENVKDNNIISANYNKGDTIEQGTLISIVVSKGKIIMPGFTSLGEFKDWADKYEIKYQENHEFSDSVAIGEVISYSHKTGDVVKNDDTITIIISDGKQVEVPSLVGMSKSEIISKLKKLDLGYSFVYKNSSSVSKDDAISQSISSGSKVSTGTTVTITLSNGKKETTTSSNNSSNTNSGSSSSSSNNSNQSSECVKTSSTTIYLYDELYDLGNPSGTCSKIKGTYSNVKINCTYSSSGLKSGMIINSSSVDSKTYSNCDTVTINIDND